LHFNGYPAVFVCGIVCCRLNISTDFLARSVKNMDYKDDSYGYPPYDEDQNTNGSDPYAPRSYRDDPSGQGGDPSSPYGQDASPYGQEPSPYGQDSGYSSGGADYPGARDYTSRYPRTSYGDQGAGYTPPQSDPYAASGENGPGPSGYGAQADPYGQSGGSRREQQNDPYSSRRTTIPRDGVDYAQRGGTGRYSGPEDDLGFGGQDEYERPRAPRNRKKRSKFSKFMHALGLYLAQLPSKTLVLFGGTFAMVLIAVILLAVLLPNRSKTEPADDGQLSLSDVTITPSLAPTDTPAPTAESTPEPPVAVLGEDDEISKSGTTSDLIPDIQKRLVELAYMDEPDGGYTNKYGPLTKTAIRLFQMKNFSDYHVWDGIIGNETYKLLMSSDAKPYYLQRGDGDDRTKIITKLVDDVTALQKRLIELGYLASGSDTGLYGNSTVLAVQKFQQYHGLDDDGIAGQDTLALIFSDKAMDAATGAANPITPAPSAGASTSPDTTAATPNP